MCNSAVAMVGGRNSTYTDRKKFEEVYGDKGEAVKVCLVERLKERDRLASKQKRMKE
jgi:hypothetical protein